MPPRPYPKPKVCLPATVHPTNPQNNIRESLKINFKNNYNSRMTVILMNPAFADQSQSDDTVNGLIKFIYSKSIKVVNTNKVIKNIGKLRVLNLFPVYNHKSGQLWDDLKKIRSANVLGEKGFKQMLDNNNRTINDVVLNDSDYIVLAWGLPDNFYISLPLYYRQIFEILNIVKQSGLPLFVFQTNNRPYLSKNENPFHTNKKKLTGLVEIKINNLNEIVAI